MSDGAPNLFEQQEINRRRSRHLVFLFVWLFGWLGFGGDFALREATRGGRLFGYEYFFPWLTATMLLLGLALTLYAWRAGPQRVLGATGARPLSEPETPAEKNLLDVVEEMAIASGLPRPRVYLLDDEDPNAFATGHDEETACIVVTEGMLRVCTRDELQAVVAHEMGHVKNLDVRLTTLLAALVGTVALMSRGIFGLGIDSKGRKREAATAGSGSSPGSGSGSGLWPGCWRRWPRGSSRSA